MKAFIIIQVPNPLGEIHYIYFNKELDKETKFIIKIPLFLLLF